jgi:hypothetical protein
LILIIDNNPAGQQLPENLGLADPITFDIVRVGQKQVDAANISCLAHES